MKAQSVPATCSDAKPMPIPTNNLQCLHVLCLRLFPALASEALRAECQKAVTTQQHTCAPSSPHAACQRDPPLPPLHQTLTQQESVFLLMLPPPALQHRAEQKFGPSTLWPRLTTSLNSLQKHMTRNVRAVQARCAVFAAWSNLLRQPRNPHSPHRPR